MRALLFAVSLVGCPVAYTWLLRTMRSRGVPHAPWLPFFFIFGTVGGWVLAAALSPSGLAATCTAFLLTAAPLASLSSSIWIAFRPERTVFHRVAMWSGFGYALVLVAGFIVLCWAMFGDRSSFQRGLSHHPELPQAASNITVFENKNFTGAFVAEFQIAEKDFVAFATEQHWGLRPVSEPTYVFQPYAFQTGHPNDKKEILDGLYYSMRSADGSGVTVGYDRKQGRAYIEKSAR